MPGARIIQSQFHSINREVKASVIGGYYNADAIGGRHHVSRETVNAVRRAGTWPQWQRNKAEANRRRVERAKAATNTPRVESTKVPAIQLRAEHEDTVTITRDRFHYFLALERRVKSEAEQPKPKRRLWSRR